MELLNEGAEAKLYRKENRVLKLREPKMYRHEELDTRLRKSRLRREFKVLATLRQSGVQVPRAVSLDEKTMQIEMEFLDGKTLKEAMAKEYLKKAFRQIILMHKSGIVHGDLTTMNMLVSNKEVYLIDFGLAEFSDKIEDKAVDLNLFFTCLKNEHRRMYPEKKKLMKIYEKEIWDGKKIYERLEEISTRGRNKKSTVKAN